MNERAMRSIGFGLLVLWALAFVVDGFPAQADVKTISDPAGDQGPMAFDIRSASHGHIPRHDYPSFLTHTVTAGHPVSDAAIQSEHLQFRFSFDTRGGDGNFERSIVVRSTSDGYQADMWRGGYPQRPGAYQPEDWVGFVRVSRPGDLSLTVSFRRPLLGKLSKPYRWIVEVYGPHYRSDCNPGSQPCYDRTKAVVHQLG